MNPKHRYQLQNPSQPLQEGQLRQPWEGYSWTGSTFPTGTGLGKSRSMGFRPPQNVSEKSLDLWQWLSNAGFVKFNFQAKPGFSTCYHGQQKLFSRHETKIEYLYAPAEIEEWTQKETVKIMGDLIAT
jgi:hypothetical protein